RHAPPLSFKPSAKKAAAQSYIELLSTKPVVPKKEIDDTTGETIIFDDAPKVRLEQGLSGAHPAQTPQALPSDSLATPSSPPPGLQTTARRPAGEHLVLGGDLISQASQNTPPPPPVPTTPMEPSLQLERPRKATPKAGVPAR